MEAVYLWSAMIGGGILVLQVVLLMVGLGDHDVDVDHDIDLDDGDVHDLGESTLFFKMLSMKTIVAFFTFFGLAGSWAMGRDWSDGGTLGLAVGVGALAFALVGWLMNMLVELQHSGTVQIEHSVGSVADVYLRVPGHYEGHGKVMLTVDNRRHEAKAVTAGTEIPTGAATRVVGMRDATTVEVIPLNEEG